MLTKRRKYCQLPDHYLLLTMLKGVVRMHVIYLREGEMEVQVLIFMITSYVCN